MSDRQYRIEQFLYAITLSAAGLTYGLFRAWRSLNDYCDFAEGCDA